MKITPENKKNRELQDELPAILVLAPFNKSPKLQFDNIKLGSSKLQNVFIRNPNVQAIEVSKIIKHLIISRFMQKAKNKTVFADKVMANLNSLKA